MSSALSLGKHTRLKECVDVPGKICYLRVSPRISYKISMLLKYPDK